MAEKLLLEVLFSLLLVSEVWTSHDVKLSDVYFDGGFLYFSVKREKLQQRLDEINSQLYNDEFKLVLPSKPVLQDVIASDEHVIMLAFGTMEAVSFEEALTNAEKKAELAIVEGLSIQIPYLKLNNDDSRGITLQMKTFITEVEHHIHAKFIPLSATFADQFVIEEKGNTIAIQFQKGDLRLRLVGEHQEYRALHDHIETKHMKEYKQHVQISISGPDFSICNKFPDRHMHLCDIHRHPQYNAVLKEEDTVVCQYWIPKKDDIRKCESTFHVASMSQPLRKLLFLDEDQDVLQSELQSGTFDIRLVFPCNGQCR